MCSTEVATDAWQEEFGFGDGCAALLNTDRSAFAHSFAGKVAGSMGEALSKPLPVDGEAPKANKSDRSAQLDKLGGACAPRR